MLDEVEKLDMILRYLYDRRNEDKEYEIREILQDLEIHTSVKEAFRLANRLAEVGVADITRMQAGHFLQISSPGIEYCQKRSFTQPNRSIISMQNFSGNFFNSQLMTAGDSVNNSSQQMGANDEVANLIQRIREVLRQEAEEEQRQDLEEYLQDVEKKVHNREKVPKLQWNALLQNSANLASTGTLMLELAQLLGFVPKT